MQPSPEARRPVLAAAGVLLVLACAALGADLATQVDHRQAYLALAQYVPEGAAITPADLAVVNIAKSPGVVAIPASDSSGVIGRHAVEALDPGGLLLPAELTSGSPLPADEALLGASLDANQLPDGLVPGDSVLVILSSTSGLPGSSGLSGTSGLSSVTPAAGGSSAASTSGSSGTSSASGSKDSVPPSLAAQGELAEGTVYSVQLPSANAATGSSSSEIVTLEVPISAAPEITAASAAGQISLAEVSPPRNHPVASAGTPTSPSKAASTSASLSSAGRPLGAQ